MKHTKSRNIPALEWLGDFAGRDTRITSMGSNMLLVENHCGICSFSDSSIVLATPRGNAEIHGCSLSLCHVRADSLVIRGCIRDVKLPCGEISHEP